MRKINTLSMKDFIELPMIKVKPKTPGTIEKHDPFGRWVSIEPAKRCVHCGEEKSIGEFHKKKSSKDGLQPWCKQCKREYNDLYKQNGGKVKVCPVCNVTKPLSEFAEGSVICKECKDEPNYKGMKKPDLASWDVVDLLLEIRDRGYSINIRKRQETEK